jgi:YLP motif-containing protein 1
MKESAPRILSLDDYFMSEESEKTVKDPVTGKDTKEKVSTYEFDPAKESKYRDNLFKAFRKTIEDGYFRFIIVDCVHDKIRHFEEMSNFAKAKRFQVMLKFFVIIVHFR